MYKESRVFVAGSRGLVGSAIVRRLRASGFTNVLERSRSELDLTRQSDVEEFFRSERPEFVFLAAAKVGGILANNTQRGSFIADNLLIQTNVISAAYQFGVKKLLFLGSSCIYPRLAPQPIKEEYLLTGPLEPTNEPYAVAKIAGLKLVEAYRSQFGFNGISLMPTNLYGPGDNFDPETSHVLPALIRRCHEAKVCGDSEIVVWGSGQVRREFLYVDDLADAAVKLMNVYDSSELINVGVGSDVTIKELTQMVCEVVDFRGKIVNDRTKPDGVPRKLLDVSRIEALGWRAQTDLRTGIEKTYRWFVNTRPAVAMAG
jgi:GDP-L-fucose synthase